MIDSTPFFGSVDQGFLSFFFFVIFNRISVDDEISENGPGFFGPIVEARLCS